MTRTPSDAARDGCEAALAAAARIDNAGDGPDSYDLKAIEADAYIAARFLLSLFDKETLDGAEHAARRIIDHWATHGVVDPRDHQSCHLDELRVARAYLSRLETAREEMKEENDEK